MALLRIDIEALAPLAFPRNKPGTQFRKSLPFVPGGAIYGALGHLMVELQTFDESLLRSLRCHNAYPSRQQDAWVRPLPISAMRPKGDSHLSPFDALVERVCWEIQQPPALIALPTDQDGRPWEAVKNELYTLHAQDDTSVHYLRRRVDQRLLTRVAINRQRGTAQETRLYSPLVINEVSSYADEREPTHFIGSVECPDASVAHVRDLLQRITSIGARQSSGIGRVSLMATEVTQGNEEQALGERVERLTERFRQQTDVYHTWGGEQWNIPPRSIFTVNLLADAILYEHGWLPTVELSPAALKAYTGIEAQLVRAMTTTAVVGGWNVTWQRPKPTELAVSMGSLYLFQANDTLSDDAITELARLQQRGIGERCSEGYGQIRICDDIHLLEREVMQ